MTVRVKIFTFVSINIIILGPNESFSILPPVTAGTKRKTILELYRKPVSFLENVDCCRSYKVAA